MIKIRNIKEEKHELFDLDDNSLGFVNDCEFQDIKIQTGTRRLEGYYFLFKDKKVPIKCTGKIERCPIGLFELNMTQLNIILSLTSNKLDRRSTLKEKINNYETTYIHNNKGQ